MKKRLVSFILTMLIVLNCCGTCLATPQKNIQYIKTDSIISVTVGSDTFAFVPNATNDTVVTTTNLNIRQLPSIDSEILATVAEGTQLERSAIGGNWDIVLYNGEACYVYNDYIETYVEPVEEEPVEEDEDSAYTEMIYTPGYFMQMGVIYWDGWRWTWYSQRVLPGYGLNIPGRHVDEYGYVCDENDYICLAASSLTKGTIVSTPFGKTGKVYDCGCAYGTLDVYCNF